MEVVNTPPALTCGQWVVYSRRCVHVNHCSTEILKSTRFSKSSGRFPFHFHVGKAVDIQISKLGTPDEHSWPGVTSFPDFKPTFPRWTRDPSRALVSGLDENGLDLLDAMLVYDPAGRISAKLACQHPYFEAGSSAYSGRGRSNGYR